MERSYKLVIARYKENLDWVEHMNKSNIIIYNKSNEQINIPDVSIIQRENFGREAETFLYYIITNYDSLPDYVIFVQGHPFDHMRTTHVTPTTFQYYIDLLLYSKPDKTIPLLTFTWPEEHGHYLSLKTREYFSLFFNFVPIINDFAPGCQYMIPKQFILNNPLEYYKRIHSMTVNGDIFNCNNVYIDNKLYDFDAYGIIGWIVERIFPHFFYGNKINMELCKKRYLILGGSEFIGCSLINELLNKNYDVVLIDNEHHKYDNIKDKIHFINDDISKLSKSGYVEGIFYIANNIDYNEKKEVQQNISKLLEYSNSFNNKIRIIFIENINYNFTPEQLCKNVVTQMEQQ